MYFHLSTLKFCPFLKNLCIESKPVIALVQYKLLNVFALFRSMETFFCISYVCSPGNYQNIFGEDWNEGGWKSKYDYGVHVCWFVGCMKNKYVPG